MKSNIKSKEDVQKFLDDLLIFLVLEPEDTQELVEFKMSMALKIAHYFIKLDK